MAQEWDDLSGMNVWKNQTQYNHERWDDDKNIASVKFCAVPWDVEYNDVVLWESEKVRDKYFDELNGYVANENTGWNFKSLEVFKPFLGQHVGTIKTSIVYEDVLNFNYVAIEMYPQPTGSHERERRERFYYFLRSSNKINANMTEISLDLDVWTTYINSVSFSGASLRRGHYTHALTDAETYLKDPLNNNYGINTLEPELPEVKPLISNEKLISFSKNSPRICIATTTDFSMNEKDLWTSLSDVKNISKPQAAVKPSENWWNNEIKTGKIGFNNLAPAPNVSVPNFSNNSVGLNVFSIAPESFNSFVNTLRKKYPQVLKTITSVYVLDSALIDEEGNINFLGFNFSKVVQQDSFKLIEQIELEKSMFGYDEKYSNFAKLYTGQFATIEISNLQGRRVEVEIEDISESLEFYSRASSAFPFLKLEAFVNGIGGKEKTTYAVKPLNNVNAELFSSQWEDFKFDFEIPTYGVFAEAAEINGPNLNAETFSKLNRNDVDLKNSTLEINTDNTNNKRSIDKDYSNDIDSIENAYINTTRSIGRDFSISKKDYETRYKIGGNEVSREFNNDTTSIKKYSDISVTSYNNNKKNSDIQVKRDYDNEKSSINRNIYVNARERDVMDNDVSIYMKEANVDANYQQAVNSENADWEDSKAIVENKRIKDTQNSFMYSQIDINNSLNWAEYKNYETSRNVNKFLAYSNISTAARQAALNVAVNGFTSLMNASSSLVTNPAGAIASAGSYVVNEAAAGENLDINLDDLVRTHNVTNGSDSLNVYNDWEMDSGKIYGGGANTIKGGEYVYATVNIEGDEYNYAGPSLTSAALNVSMERRFQEISNRVRYEGSVSNLNITANSEYVNSYIAYTDSLNRVILDRYTEINSLIKPLKKDSISLTKKINDRNNDTDSSINLNTRDENYSINTNEKAAAKSINDTTVSADTNVAERNKSVGTTNVNLEKDNSEYSTNTSNTVNKLINDSDRSANKGIAERNKTVETQINDLEISTRKTNLQNTFNNNLKEFAADAFNAIYDEPLMFGSNSGNAWVDAWGQRGLDIRIKRCSKAAEKIAGNLFYRYGYRVDNVWVDEINLSLMEKFTYWETEDIWIMGERINETSKDILRNIFNKGITVWNKPSEVKNVDITTNTIRS